MAAEFFLSPYVLIWITKQNETSSVGFVLIISFDAEVVWETSHQISHSFTWQDRDESRESLRKGLPVVSFSIGDSAEFLFGDYRDVDGAERVMLESGDVVIFGGESRMVFHGISSVVPNSAPKALLDESGLRPGRLNLTFRQF